MLVLPDASAQKEWSFGNYHYLGGRTETGIVPVLHMETSYHWSTELRYNYEAPGAVSALTGYSFRGGKNWEYRISPMAGFSAGKYNSWCFGVNTELSKGRFYLSAENEYSVATDRNNGSFIYSWSEAGVEIMKHGLLGVSMQYYQDRCTRTCAPGLMAGIRLDRVTLPVYMFNPAGEQRYFVVGFNYAFDQ